MKLMITVPVPPGIAVDDPYCQKKAHEAAAQKASAWTEPVYVDEITPAEGDHPDGWRILRYICDGVPKPHPSIVTTANIAPALQSPKVTR